VLCLSIGEPTLIRTFKTCIRPILQYASCLVVGSIVPLTDTVKLPGVTIVRHLTFDITCTERMQVRVLSHTGFEAHPLIPFHRHGENGCICVGDFATRLRQLSTVLYSTELAVQ